MQAFKKYFLSSTTLAIPAETTLAGDTNDPEQVVVGTGSYYDRQSALRSSATTAISIGRGGSLERVTLTRSGLTMPWSTNTHVTNNIAAYGGTGVDISETGSTVQNSMLLGFTTAISGSFASDEGRARVMFNKIDATNGVSFTGARDLNIFAFNHGWPFLSAHTSGVSDANLSRSGIFATFAGTYNEASLSVGNFEYGWATGWKIEGPNITSAFDQNDHVDGAGKTAYLLNGASYFRIVGGSSIICQVGADITGTANVPGLNSIGKWWQASDAIYDLKVGSLSSIGNSLEGRSQGAFTVPVGYRVAAGAQNFTIIGDESGNLTEVLKIASGWTGYGLFVPGMTFAANTTWITAATAELNRVTILNANPQNGMTNQLLRPLRINMVGTPEHKMTRSDGGAGYKNFSTYWDGTNWVVRILNDAESGVTVTLLQINATTGRISFPNMPSSTTYANDGAAAAGGVAVGELYRNGSVVQCRIT